MPQTQYAPRQFFYMNTKHKNLLLQKIKDLPFTEDLKNILRTYDIKTLQDLLNIELYNWHKKLVGFNYHHQYEIIACLQEAKLMKFLKEK